MKIGVIGGNGFLGSAIVAELKQYYEAIIITKESIPDKYDVLINANGNANKRWANDNSGNDYKKSVVSTINYLLNYQYDFFIQISSVDAIRHEDVYGKNKKIAEQHVRKYAKKHLIIRCGALIGKGMTKGVIHDLKNGMLFVSPESKIQFIPVKEVAKNIKYAIDNEITGTHTFTCHGNITVSNIINKYNLTVKSKDKKHEQYKYITSWRFKFKKAIDYLQGIL